MQIDLNELEVFLDEIREQGRVSTPQQEKLNNYYFQAFNKKVHLTNTCASCIGKRMRELRSYIEKQRKTEQAETPTLTEDTFLEAGGVVPKAKPTSKKK